MVFNIYKIDEYKYCKYKYCAHALKDAICIITGNLVICFILKKIYKMVYPAIPEISLWF